MLTTFLYEKGKPLNANVSRADMHAALRRKDTLLWVDLENPNEFEAESLVEIFNFHPLAVEDCTSEISEPKVDDYDEYLFVVTHALRITPEDELATIELDIFIGKNYVVTFHKEPLRSVEQVRDMVQKKPDLYLSHGSDVLFHSILDHLVDNYMPVLNRYDHKIDTLEEQIFNNPPDNYLSTVMQVKSDIFNLRRIVGPQRDTVYYLTRNASEFIQSDNLMYFRDVYDHLFRIYGMAEGYHESLQSILQAYFSYSSHKLNEIVKRMTILATLTMPMVIVASIYGMNFKNMPELNWPHGYYFSIGLMIAIAVVMLIWMKFKKWI